MYPHLSLPPSRGKRFWGPLPTGCPWSHGNDGNVIDTQISLCYDRYIVSRSTYAGRKAGREQPVQAQSNTTDTTPAILRKYLDGVEEALDALLAPNDPDIGVMLRYHLGRVDESGRPTALSQGKRLRPSLCMFACEAVGGLPERALPAAAALELVHNFSLIHDDIQDGDLQRHHRPTVWAVWGKPKALQAGNVMRVMADVGVQRVLGEGLAPEVVAGCSLSLSRAYLEMIEGQWLDMDFEGRTDVDTAAYLEMIARKTGALIRCSMHMGSLVGNGDAETVQAMTRCGRYLGLAFQIRDDYLGVWGCEEETGKPIGSDLRRKKNSLPLVYAMERAGSAEREQIQSIYAREEVDDRDVASMMGILEQLGVSDYVQRLAEKQAALAREALESVPTTERARKEMEELVEFLLTRQR